MSQELTTSQNREAIEAALTAGLDAVSQSAPSIKFPHQLFEQHAARTPNQLAVVCDGRKLTYGELDSRANQLAHHLRSRGVGRNTLVAICVDRSLEIVVGMLGVLKAGGAYVALDPELPCDHLRWLIDDAVPAMLLTQSHIASRLPICQARTLLLDALYYATHNGHNLKAGPKHSAADLAYLIYTATALAKPQGVMITQGNLAHSLRSIERVTRLSESDVYLHSASISLSSSVRQLFLPLAVGATIVIAPANEINDPVALFRLIKQRDVTVFDTTPAYWQQCIDALKLLPSNRREDLLDNQLGLILSESQALPSHVPRAWRFKLKHGADLINVFGLPETAGAVAAYPIVPRPKPSLEMVPIGRAISDTQIYLLDDQLRAVEFGEPGEICVGGATVGRGYFKHAALTAERFCRNPFSKRPGALLYRTGSLGRLTADGTLEWQGRIESATRNTNDLDSDVTFGAEKII